MLRWLHSARAHGQTLRRMSPSRKCYQFRLMLRAARAPAVRAPRCAPRPLQRPVCVRPVQRLDLGASRHRLFSTSASAPPEPPAVALSQATKVDAQAPPSGPTNAEDRERPRYTYRQKPAQPQERWFSALKKQQIGAAIDFLKQDNPGKAPAWTQCVPPSLRVDLCFYSPSAPHAPSHSPSHIASPFTH